MKNKIIKVSYLDSALYNAEEFRDHNFQPCVFDIVGFFIKEDEKSLTLAREIRTEEAGEKVRGVVVVPKVAIVKRQVLKDK